jgi:hypothetical protein
MVSKILNLYYTIPIHMVSQVFMCCTLKCSIVVEDEPFLSQTWNPSVLYDNSHPNGLVIHAQWFSCYFSKT